MPFFRGAFFAGAFFRGAFFRPVLRFILPFLLLAPASVTVWAAQGGNAGTVHGTVTDPSGAVIPNANVHITNHVSGFERSVPTDATGQFTVTNVPFNPYHLTVSATGFAAASQNL